MLIPLIAVYAVAALLLLPRLLIHRIDALVARLDALQRWEIH